MVGIESWVRVRVESQVRASIVARSRVASDLGIEVLSVDLKSK